MRPAARRGLIPAHGVPQSGPRSDLTGPKPHLTHKALPWSLRTQWACHLRRKNLSEGVPWPLSQVRRSGGMSPNFTSSPLCQRLHAKLIPTAKRRHGIVLGTCCPPGPRILGAGQRERAKTHLCAEVPVSPHPTHSHPLPQRTRSCKTLSWVNSAKSGPRGQSEVVNLRQLLVDLALAPHW